MGQISPLLELRGSNGSFKMGSVEGSGAEETPSHFMPEKWDKIARDSCKK